MIKSFMACPVGRLPSGISHTASLSRLGIATMGLIIDGSRKHVVASRELETQFLIHLFAIEFRRLVIVWLCRLLRILGAVRNPEAIPNGLPINSHDLSLTAVAAPTHIAEY